MEAITKILFDFDKLPSKLVLIILFLSGILLFAPPDILTKVKLETFSLSYGQWAGIAFVTSLSFLAVTLVTTIQNKIRRRSNNRSIEKDIRDNLRRLDPLEQSILREFYIAGSTVNLPMDHATVVGLQDKHLIRLAQSNLGGNYFVSGNFGMPCMLTDYAKSIIDSNQTLIGLPLVENGQPTKEQKKQLMETRPPSTRQFEMFRGY